MQARHVLTILAVADVDRALGFYERAFGCPVAVRTAVYVELALAGGMRLGLYQREGFARNTGTMPVAIPPDAVGAAELYFHVDDLVGAAQRLRRAGARELAAPAPREWGDEVGYFADPDGHVLALARPL